MENEIENRNAELNLVTEVTFPLFNSKGWIRFLGVLMIIYGVILALTLMGIVIAWLPIWLGILLIQTANRIEQAHVTGDKIMLIKAQSSLATYFTIYGVLALIGLIIFVVMIIVGLSTGFFMHMQDFGMESYY